jgi:threo-3-hydroxy-L-aspartate ammonia-lyase
MLETIIGLADVQAAAERLQGVAHHTPVATSRTLNARSGRQVFLKCENFQRAGAFKFRGAYNCISQLDAGQRARGVVAYSSGNHAQGVALAARLLAVPAIICMPTDAPPVKRAATESYGATVLTYDRATTGREDFAQQVAQERDMVLVPPFDHPQIMAGQGSTALELLAEVTNLDALVMPVGGGGLLSGCALAACSLQPDLRVFGVETPGADDMKQSLERGERLCIPPPATIADGIRTQAPGALTFPLIQEYVEDILLVSDEEVLETLRFLLIRMKLVVEPTGAVGLAAVLHGRLSPKFRRVGVILSGGNLDPALLTQLWPAE